MVEPLVGWGTGLARRAVTQRWRMSFRHENRGPVCSDRSVPEIGSVASVSACAGAVLKIAQHHLLDSKPGRREDLS